MGDPEEFSANSIALSTMQDQIRLEERVKQLEEKLESLDKDMNTVFEAINTFHHILYLKNPEEK